VDDVAVSVVCTSNAPALTSCLAALPEAAEGLRWRATVVDNASTDGVSELVRERFAWAALVRNERRRGFAANHNLTLLPAIAASDARYVLVLNDDTIFDPGALAAMVAEMDATPDLGCLGPRIRGLDGAPQQSLFGYPSLGHLLAGQVRPGAGASQPALGGVGWLNGSCLLLRVAALAEVGSLDERYFIFFEDTDLGRRLLDSGWRSAVARDAGMVHLEHQTVGTPALSSVMARQMLRSRWLYVRRYHGRAAAALLSAVSRTALLARAAKAALTGAREHAGHMLVLARYSPRRPLPHEASV
jgi:N-acetylglucosaminyl-diphospho-decaprenol L-rhamnosyltransferase